MLWLTCYWMVSVNHTPKHLLSVNHGGHSTALASKAYGSFGSVLLARQAQEWFTGP